MPRIRNINDFTGKDQEFGDELGENSPAMIFLCFGQKNHVGREGYWSLGPENLLLRQSIWSL